MARWLREPVEKSSIEDVLFSQSLKRREIVCEETLHRAWKEHLEGADHSWLLYRVLTTELWYRQFVDAWQPQPAFAPQRL